MYVYDMFHILLSCDSQGSMECIYVCMDIDNNAEVVATMTVSEICQAVADDKSKLVEESES